MRVALDMFRASGFGRLVLLLVTAWALVAVVLLTMTLIRSGQIDDDASVVAGQTEGADRDLEAVARLKRTTRLTRGIDAQLRPLPRILGEEVVATRGIDRSARGILAEVGSIRAHVFSVETLAASVGGHVDSIHRHAGSILGRAAEIRSLLGATLVVSKSIDDGVAGINARADQAIERAAAIERDLAATRREAGPDHAVEGVGPTIAGHAHSLDCSPLVSPERHYCEP